jgi:hypothetical protein
MSTVAKIYINKQAKCFAMFYYQSAQYPQNSTIIQVQGSAVNKQIENLVLVITVLNFQTVSSLKGKIVTHPISIHLNYHKYGS